jgi:serine/threonine protein kinase
VLLDFGAARQTLLSDTPILKPMYTPGFASPEQFHSREALGPWSDIYSVGASMYACLAGSSPQRSDERVKHDNVVPATKAWAGQYSPHFLATIDWCLQLDPLKRPQSCFALQKVLAQRHREAPPQQKTWLEGLGSRLKTMIGRT